MATFPKLALTCPMKWDEMRGDERERFCAKCNRHVVNLSILTDAQRAALLASAHHERLCVAYYQRLSGRTNPPTGPTRRAGSRRLLRWGAAAAFVGTLATITSQIAQHRTDTTTVQESMTETYYSVRYRVEGWIDDVRVFFGGTPRYTGMTLGVVCEPSVPLTPPPTPPASSSPPPQIEESSGGNPG